MAIMTESSMKDYYRNQQTNGRNTYDYLYSNIGLQEQIGLDSLKYDYDKALNDAYVSSQYAATDIMAGNFSKGYKERELSKLDPMLQDAYNKYTQNYQQGVYNIKENAATARAQIDTQLTNQAHMATNLANSSADYLRYLWESTKDNENSVFYNDPKLSRFVKTVDDEKTLVTDEDLMNMLYDENGIMTIAGTEFYDLMLNADRSLFGDEVLDYDTWLYNQQQGADEKSNYYGLYDWYNAYNPYDMSTDEYGLPTNKAYLRTAFGLASSDNAYLFAERFGGFTKEELDSYFEKFKTRFENTKSYIDKYGKDKPEKVYEELDGMIKDLRKLAYDFGIEDELEGTFKAYEDIISKAKNNSNSAADMAQDFFGPFLSTSGEAAAVGFAIGGPLGAAISAGIGSIFGAIAGGEEVDSSRNENKDTAQQVRNLYNTVLTTMYNMSMNKRKIAQDEYYKNNK